MTGLKIGVLTFHRCINYGSYWQARCLAEGLQARGHRIEILDHFNATVNFSEWKCALQPTLPTPAPPEDRTLYREKINRFFEAFASLPLSRPFPLEQPGAMDRYDLVVVGSDEVWNLFHPWFGRRTLFYGEGIEAPRLVSYAASFGNYDASWGLEQTWSNRLRNFHLISVRDYNSQRIVQNALGFTPTLVLDPCLQFPIHAEAAATEHMDQPFAAVYGHNFSRHFIQEIKRWAAHRNLRLISIGYRNDWADKQWLAAGPHQFAHFMKNAHAIVTNFFHGCVFALHNEKPFVCEAPPYRSNKLQGLMAKVGGQQHLVHDGVPSSHFDACLNRPLKKAIAEQIATLRHHANNYLNRALKSEMEYDEQAA